MDESVHGGPRGPRGGVTTRGSGSADAVPDVARVRLAATAADEHASRALSAASGTLAAMRAAVLGAGVEPADMRTAGTTSWTEGGVVVDVPGGGQVTRHERTVVQLALEVTVRSLDRTGEVAAAALTAGGDGARLEGTSFHVTDAEEARREARAQAFERAVGAARQLAELAGRELGPVLDVREGGTEQAPGARMMTAAMDEAGGGPAFDAGTSTVRVEVVVRHGWAAPA